MIKGLATAEGGEGFIAPTTNVRRLSSWLLASTIICSTSICIPSAASAQQSSTPSSARAGAVQFSIPAQPLPAAINAFIRATGWQVGYSTRIADGIRSRPVSGTMPPAQALQALLAGTGVNVRFTGPNTATLVSPSIAAGGVPVGAIPLDTIDVQGAGNPNSTMTLMPAYAGGQVARGGQLGMLGNRDVMNTPFSTTNYTNKTIQDQQARTVSDVLNNDPSVIASTSTVSDVDIQTIRGFGGYGYAGSRTLNGMAGMSPLYFPSSDYVERVEILKGPSALLNGMAISSGGSGALGGSVNLVTKRATNEPITTVTTRYVSNSQFGTHLDVGRRFGAGSEFGVRFNGSIDGGRTPIDTQKSKFGTAALNLDYSGERFRLSADIAHQSQELTPNTGLFSARRIGGTLTSFPRAPSSTLSLLPSGSKFETKSTMGMIRGEVDILENVTAYAAVGKQQAESGINGSGYAMLTDGAGQYSVLRQITRDSWDTLTMQGGIRANANTGPVDHALSLNLSRSTLTNKTSASVGGYLASGSIYNPVFPIMPSITDPGSPKTSAQVEVSSIGFSDTLSIFDERIQLTAGIRYQVVGAENFNTTTGLLSSEYDANAWTPAFGLVVKPWENVSLYANYIEDLSVGTTVGTAYANAGEVFAPYVRQQYEAGVKVDWGQVTTTLAVFQIAEPSEISIADPAGGLPTLAPDGEQRNRGIELNAYGKLTPGLRLMGGVTFIDARLTKTEDGTLDGKRATSVPRVRAVIGAEWDTPFVEGLTLTGRVTHTGDAVVSASSGVTIPSWTTLDLGARYTFDSPWNQKPVTVRFNVDNVFDKDYWAGAYSNGFVYRGQPRIFRLSTEFKF